MMLGVLAHLAERLPELVKRLPQLVVLLAHRVARLLEELELGEEFLTVLQ